MARRRDKDHPQHQEWLVEQRVYSAAYRRRKGLVTGRSAGRPRLPNCICPTCGTVHKDRRK